MKGESPNRHLARLELPGGARRIPVEINLNAAVFADPQNLFVALRPDEKLPTLNISLCCDKDVDELEIISVDCDVDWLKAEFHRETDRSLEDGRGLVTVKVIRRPAGLSQFSARGRVVVITNHPECREVLIPVVVAGD